MDFLKNKPFVIKINVPWIFYILKKPKVRLTLGNNYSTMMLTFEEVLLEPTFPFEKSCVLTNFEHLTILDKANTF